MRLHLWLPLTGALILSMRRVDLAAAGRQAAIRLFRSVKAIEPLIPWLEDFKQGWVDSSLFWSPEQVCEMVKLANQLPSYQANLLAGPEVLATALPAIYSIYGRVIEYQSLQLGYLRMTKGPGCALLLPNGMRDELMKQAVAEPDLAWLRGLCEHGTKVRASTLGYALSFGFCHHYLGQTLTHRIAPLAYPRSRLSPDRILMALIQSWYFISQLPQPMLHPLWRYAFEWIMTKVPPWISNPSLAWLLRFYQWILSQSPFEPGDCNAHFEELWRQVNNLTVSVTERARFSLILFAIELYMRANYPSRLPRVLGMLERDLAPIDLHHFLIFCQRRLSFHGDIVHVCSILEYARWLPRFHGILLAGGHYLTFVDWHMVSRPRLSAENMIGTVYQFPYRIVKSRTWQEAAQQALAQLRLQIQECCKLEGSIFEPRSSTPTPKLVDLWITIFKVRTLQVVLPVRPSPKILGMQSTIDFRILCQAVLEFYNVVAFNLESLFRYLFV